MNVIDFGVGDRMKICREILGRAPVNGKLLLLPIPTSKDKRYITGTDVTIGKITEIAETCDAIAGYDIPTEICNCQRIYDAALDEDFQIANAVLTAKGTLGFILTELRRDISELNLGIVGYGRIGRELLRLILLMGVAPTVYTNRKSVVLKLGELGIHSETIGEATSLGSIDLLINTAPARQIEKERLSKECLIIDLASGNCFDPDERLVKLPSIPEKFYPITAGRLYAEHILRFLGWEEKK